MITHSRREQLKDPLHWQSFETRTTQSSPTSTLKSTPHSPDPNILNGDTFSIPDDMDGLDSIQMKQVHPELNQSDPFGFLQADRELARAASTSREGVRANNTQSHSDRRRDVNNSPSKSVISTHEAHIPTTQAQNHQDSDVSLGDLLNINKNKRNRTIHSKKITVARKKTPQDTTLSSSPSSRSAALSSYRIELDKESRTSQRQTRYPRKAKLIGLENLSKNHPRREIPNDENPSQAERTVTSPEALQGRVETKALKDLSEKREHKKQENLSKKSETRPKKKKHPNDENCALTPIVVINTKSDIENLRKRTALQPKTNRHDRSHPISKDRKIQRDSKSSNRKRPNLQLHADNVETRDDQDSPPPDRKARLSYYKSLDNLSLEEEIVI